MHVVFRETHGLEAAGAPVDLGQSPADLVALSFSDSDLAAFAAGWRRADGALPSLRLANLAALTHPLSVDTYVERTLSGAKGILIRLIGGAAYWSYGLQHVQALARDRGIALAVLPADGRRDPALEAASTVPVSTLHRLAALCDGGGAVAAQAALAQMALAAGLYAGPVRGAKTLPDVGGWTPEDGPACPAAFAVGATRPRVLVVFYRAYLSASDTEPMEALVAALRAQGFDALGLFAPSLKAPDAAAWLRRWTAALEPAAIVNATAFSARGADGASPLDVAAVPVFQIALATSTRQAWEAAPRGLSPADLAMHVVLPEVDGRLFAGVASFKEARPRDPALEFAQVAHRADPDRIAAVAARVAAWTRLAALPPAKKRVALVLSTYPGKPHQTAHAVGLDALASVEAILEDMAADGYAVAPTACGYAAAPTAPGYAVAPAADGYAVAPTADGCTVAPAAHAAVAPAAPGYAVAPTARGYAVPPAARGSAVPPAAPGYAVPPTAPGYAVAPAADGSTVAPAASASGAKTLAWPLASYRAALAALPASLQADLATAWGDPADDPACHDGAFRFAARWRGAALVALQPERGAPRNRDAEYHDLTLAPRHGYVAFYLWLRALGINALVHVGAHGTLEWLPGKAVALSAACWPEALVGPTPVIYPFIVNDPGEAAQAKRRIGALTIGHAPPPLRTAGGAQPLARLEALLDEFSGADGLDPARRDRLVRDIRDEARAAGVEADLGLATASAAEALVRIDRFVCDVKESQFGDGLHVFGRVSPAPGLPNADATAAAERAGLRDALAGRRVAPGPSGSPWRGRADVLPTGRNLYTTDPRAVPSRAAVAQGVKLAEELIRRHLQDHGDYPRGLVVDLWGSATMRTAGEEFAMALHLIGAKPVWDDGSDRVSGVEITPLALLDRPRIDTTLRVSGLFRDVFPTLSALFAQAVRALAARDEALDFNPYAARPASPRVYGPAPGAYGLGMNDAAEDYAESGRARAGRAWLRASAWALDGETATQDATGIAARVAQADAFVHLQDLPETDLLLAADYAAHEAGFAAAQHVAGGQAALYHLDATNPDRPRARTLREEIARTVRGRAANPAWVAGMMRHGFRGGAEIAATLDHLAAFAHLAGVVEPHLIDAYHDATLGRTEVRAFLARENPAALAAMEARLAALRDAGLWTTRRNSIAAALA